MIPALYHALAEYLLAPADDELILGHRDSEWCGHAPIIEEDIAYANIALDEIGHAALWYETIASLLGEDPATYPDRMVYRRAADEYRCAQIVELPNGDWAFTMLRQFLLDSLEITRLDFLQEFPYPPVAEAATRLRKEETYHHRHSRLWVTRLAQGTPESHARMQAALDELWPYTRQLLMPLPQEPLLVEAGYLPPGDPIHAGWGSTVLPVIAAGGLAVPAVPDGPVPARSEHTQHLHVLLAEMQSVPRMDPGAGW